MPAFTHGEMSMLRYMLNTGEPMSRLCYFANNHSRDEVVEAVDALRRNETITKAQRHVNHVLALQAAQEPLVNGNPQASVCRNWGRREPMF